MSVQLSNKKTKGIWTESENHLLIKLVEEMKGSSWKDIANALNKQSESCKTGKQCRERYRNYANPTIDKSEWKPNEKILVVILHEIYGNQWSNIAKLLNQRSDVVMKNYFYSLTRKALKMQAKNEVPTSIIKKLHKFYQVFTCLEYVRTNYLEEPINETRPIQKEKIIVNLLKDRNITSVSIKNYQTILINRLKEYRKSELFPQEIVICVKDFNFTKEKTDELISRYDMYNISPLCEVVRIRLEFDQISIPAPNFTKNALNIPFSPDPLYRPTMPCAPYYSQFCQPSIHLPINPLMSYNIPPITPPMPNFPALAMYHTSAMLWPGMAPSPLTGISPTRSQFIPSFSNFQENVRTPYISLGGNKSEQGDLEPPNKVRKEK